MTKITPTRVAQLARLGYTARGLIYLVIGTVTILAALGRSEKTDSSGAMEKILASNFGYILGAALMFGFICYFVWRLTQALADTDEHGWTPHGIATRLGLIVSGFVYGALAVYTWSLLRGVRSSEPSGDNLASTMAGFIGSEWTATVLSLIFAGVAVAHFIKAFRTKYEDHFEASERVMQYIHPIAISGLAARGIVFLVIALLLFYRGRTAGDADSNPGLKTALEFIESLPAGSVLLGGMGIGLLAFALYSLTEAVWRRIHVPHSL